MRRRSPALLFLVFPACAVPAPSPAPASPAAVSPARAPAGAEPAPLPAPTQAPGTEAAPPVAHAADPAPPEAPPPRLTSRGLVTWIYAHPRTTERFVGYVRTGRSIALRSRDRVRGEGCPGGFYPVAPRGFVCNDRTVTLAPSARAVEESDAAAGGAGPLPYRYAFSDGAPMYNRIPTEAEQRRAERGYGPRGSARRAHARHAVYEDLASLDPIPATDPVPPFLRARGTAAEGRVGLVKNTLPAGSVVSFTRAFSAGGRTWLLSADQTLVPADRVRLFTPSTFHGVRLGEGVRLPIAWTRRAPRDKYRRRPDGAFEPAGSAWPARSFVPIEGAPLEHDGRIYLPTREIDADGSRLFVRREDATVVAAAERLPTGVAPGQKWMDVSITQGTLVAYEGLVPVYATLISPGRGGVPVPGRDSVKDSTTPIGTYNITFKDRASTMSPDRPGQRTQFIADVPHVQYFKAPFALHGAFWHDRFGDPASAGCINASPEDAEALFRWSDPEVPPEWQGASGAGAPGAKTTAVVVHR